MSGFDHARVEAAAESRSGEAARIAASTRERLIEAVRSFTAETVSSCPARIESIRPAIDRDYEVNLHMVMITDPCPCNASRIVVAGGCRVPEEKIRHRRPWSLVAVAVAAE